MLHCCLASCSTGAAATNATGTYQAALTHRPDDATLNLRLDQWLKDARLEARHAARAFAYCSRVRRIRRWRDVSWLAERGAGDGSRGRWGCREAEFVLGGALPLRLDELDAGFAEMNAMRARLACATSAIAARQILDVRGPDAVVLLLKDLRGTPFDTAFRQRLFMPYAEFQRLIRPASCPS
jgi:hypothetical protein